MRETEITVQLFDSLENIHASLLNQGYKVDRTFIMNDHYYTTLQGDLKNYDFKTVINNSFLTRHLADDINGEIKTLDLLIFKNKIFDENGDVIEEEKIQSKVENADNCVKIFEMAGLHPYIISKSNNIVYKNDTVEFVVQNVENLGIFIELEELDGMQDLTPEQKTNDLINIIKSLNLKTGTDYNCKKLYMLLHKNENS